MSIFLNSILIFSQIFILTIFISLSGYVLRKLVINFAHLPKFEEDGLYGFILIGFISLLLNFFIPLNIFFNSIFFIIIILIGIYFGFFRQNKVLVFKNGLLISVISFLMLIYSTVNRPDAWLYHLPYSSILNEHKIIIGVANIHERFAHISIFQYISSFFNNYLFLTNGILIPISLVTSFFFIYTFKDFNKNFLLKSKAIYSYLTFLILIVSLYAFNRYSEYGNDAQSHIFYFFFIIILFKYFLLKKNIITLKELSILSLFIFLIKPTFILIILLPIFLYFYFEGKFNIFKSFSFLFCCMFFIMWISKNFLATGCLIYPLLSTCYEKISWKTTNLSENLLVNESWSKGWPDQKEQKILNKSEYVKKFNWVETWSNNHLLFVLKKILPVILFFVINFLILYFTKNLKRNTYNRDFLYLLLFSLFFIFLWFIKFPVYRLGISQIYVFLILIFYFLFIKNIKLIQPLMCLKYMNKFIIFVVLILLIKNSLRIIHNSNNQLMPNIYYSSNDNRIEKVYNKKNIFTHFKTVDNDLCGYSKSPCTHLEKNFLIKKKLGYKIFIIN